MLCTHCLTVSSLDPVALSSWSLVLTSQMGLVQVEAEKPAAAADSTCTNGVSRLPEGTDAFRLRLAVEYVKK